MTQAASTPLDPPRALGWLARPLQWLAAPSDAVRFGVRWGAAVSACLWVAQGGILGYQLPHTTFLIFTVLFVAQPTAGASIQKAIYRIIGTLLAGLAAVVIWGWSAQLPALAMVLIFLVYAAGVYWMTGPRAQYVGTVMAFTTGIILGDSYPFTNSHVEAIAIDRVIQVCAGIGIVFAVESLLWPVRAGKGLIEALAQRAEILRKELGACLDALGTGRPLASKTPAAASLAAELKLVGLFRMDLAVDRARGEAAERATVQLEVLALRGRQLHELLAGMAAESEPDSDAFLAAVGDLRDAVDAALFEVAAAIREERPPAPFAGRVEAAYAAFEEERVAALEVRLGAEGAQGQISRQGLANRARQAPILRDLVLLLARLEASFRTMGGGPEESGGLLHGRRAPFWRRFHIDLFQLQAGMRGGLAVCLSLWLMLSLGWTASSLAMTLAFVFVAGATTRTTRAGVAMLLKVTLIATLIADFSMVYLFPHLQRMPLALVYSFSLMAVLGYLQVSRPKAFGSSASLYALIIVLPIFAGSSVPTDVYGPYSTATYILLASAAAIFAAMVFWPATASQVFRKRSGGQLDLCRQIFESVRASDDFRADGVRERLAAYGAQLAQLSQLHAQAQTDPDNEAADDQRRADLLVRTEAVMDGVLQVRAIAATNREDARVVAARELDDLRDALSRQDAAISASLAAAAAFLRDDEPDSSSPLEEAYRGVIDRVESLRGNRRLAQALGARLVYDFVADADARNQLAAAQLDVEQWIADWRASKVAA